MDAPASLFGAVEFSIRCHRLQATRLLFDDYISEPLFWRAAIKLLSRPGNQISRKPQSISGKALSRFYFSRSIE